MKSQHATFKRIAITIAVGAFLALAFALPSVSAQGENPVTPTPSGQLLTPEPLQAPEIQQQAEAQALREAATDFNLAEEWSLQAGISLETKNASEPKLAIDANGVKHFAWSQQTLEGASEIYYSRVFPDPSSENGELTQSIPVNVSNSPSLPSSIPQIVVDSDGIAHIVWQDKDGTDHYEVFYCDLGKPELMTFAASPKNDFSV